MSKKLVVYTDGSCIGNPGPGGWAAALRWTGDDGVVSKIVLSGGETTSTNNREETKAIVYTLEFLVDYSGALEGFDYEQFDTIEFRTDSSYVITCSKGVAAGKIYSKNSDLWNEYSKYSKMVKSVTYTKVKGHSMDTYNDEVDGIAKGEARLYLQ
jgi:ribonuclease HI